MVFKKYVRKQARRAKKYLKRRYVPNGKLDIGKIASDVYRLKGLINSELKVKDYTRTPLTLATQGAAWDFYRLNELVAQDGADKGEREGMSVRFKSLQIRGRLVANTPAATVPRRARMIIFIDKNPLQSGIAVAPAVTELLATGGTTTIGYVNSMRNWDSINSKRFSVIADKTFVFEDDKPEHLIKFYKKLDMVTTWVDGYTAGDAMSRNSLYMCFVTDVTTGSTETIALDFHARMTYRDN